MKQGNRNRHFRYSAALRITTLVVPLALWALTPARAQYTDRDWVRHRGTPAREGHNGDPGLNHTLNRQLGPTWVWPASRDMPAEIVTDNTTLPTPGPSPTGQSFEVAGTWTWPAASSRAAGAWPPSDADYAKLGDYVHHFAEVNSFLGTVGLDVLAGLPNLDVAPVPDPDNPGQLVTLYGLIERQLRNSANYARWSFGAAYPAGTLQGTMDVGGTPLKSDLRYAVYLRFPASGTFIADGNGDLRAHPNADHAFVRVSWGADVNDPATSRIFMLDTGQTGGFWLRIRTDASDDRYFPYDGTNPIRVTLYTVVPEDVNDADRYPYKPVITADAVRLVPEALRGEINAPAVSAVFPPGADTSVAHTQLTYFGRDETTGPQILFPTAAHFTQAIGFRGIPLNPTRPATTDNPVTNPLVADVTTSVRSAVFYCLEDRVDPVAPANGSYGRLRWRYPTRSLPIVPTTIDDVDAPASGFTVTSPVPSPPVWTNEPDPAQEPYGVQYRWTPVAATNTLEARWAADIPVKGPTPQTFSVYVYLPAGSVATKPARYARYHMDTEDGGVDVRLDQRNTADGMARAGMWRLLATGIRFKLSPDGSSQRCEVVLSNESSEDVAEDASRILFADAIRFVPESQTPNSVVASPLVASVRWPSGTTRQVVYFGTTDGHLWALDAIGADPVGPAPKSTLTTAYWVYPSLSNPDPAGDLNNNGLFDGPQDDPNCFADPENNRTTQGIDADLLPSRAAGNPNGPFTLVNKAPDLGAFLSSPVYVEIEQGAAPNVVRIPLILVGNQNGRLYAFDPAGRTDGAGEPFAATIATGPGTPGQSDTPGIPGTTRRLMTWPTVARDKWLSKGGSLLPDGSFAGYTDDPSRVSFAASPTVVTLDANHRVSRMISGAGDGHVYAVDLQTLDRRVRISNAANDGKAIWQWPESTTALEPIVQPGALTGTGNYIFSAGGRVYCIKAPAAASGQPKDGAGRLIAEWTYPYATAPANPDKTGDAAAVTTAFTAPAWLNTVSNSAGVQLNGGKEVAFVANADGRIFALDASRTGNPAAGGLLFESWSRGSTRASVTYLDHMPPQTWYQDVFTGDSFPGLILPLDTGGVTAVSAVSQGRLNAGDLMWSITDGQVGRVPLSGMGVNGPLPDPIVYPTSTAQRGADATLANSWMFVGDEGNRDTGEANGQMRAYWRARTAADPAGLGMVTPDEPDWSDDPDETEMSMKLVELWYGPGDAPPGKGIPVAYGRFGQPQDAPDKLSPISEWNVNHEVQYTLTNPDRLVVYEWGDTVYAAAWGVVATNAANAPLPTVTFRLFGVGQSRPPMTVGAVRDYAAPAPPVPPSPPYPAGTQYYPWVAKVAFPLGRGSSADPQTPGRRYTVLAQAQLAQSDGTLATSLQLIAGQATIDKNEADPYDLDGGLASALKVTTRKEIAIAHPLALSTRAVPTGNQIGPNVLNSIGWTGRVPNATAAQEVLANGNDRYNLPAGNPPRKDLAAPIGMIGHGGSSSYLGVDAQGRRTEALLIADRSNLYKLNQRLNNIRVERRGLQWGWNRSGSDPTGNVMNPLPWETFPITVPNTSPDYPDIDRSAASLRIAGIDIAAGGGTIPNKAPDGSLRYVPIDLSVRVPRYQPANVNLAYFDVNNGAYNAAGQLPGLAAPMLIHLGRPPQTPAEAPAGTLAPSAGYYGGVVVYVDSNGDGRYQGSAIQSRASRVTQTVREEVYRQFATGVAVPPDLSMRAEEETIDLGKVPHSAGYVPGIPFSPSYMGPWLNAVNPFDTTGGPALFAPFTIKNTGNVNLVNPRVAKLAGNAPDAWAYPGSWSRLSSDQVSPTLPVYDSQGMLVTGVPAGHPFDLPMAWQLNSPLLSVGLPMPFNLGLGPGSNYGIVSSLDHGNTGGIMVDSVNVWPFDLKFAPGFTPFRPDLEPGNPYIRAGNALGWIPGRNMRPTLHKPLPGDSGPTVLSIPDVAHGDPFGLLAGMKAMGRDVRPRIGIAPPLGTPVGTYTAPVYVFEDNYPVQWRQWLAYVHGAASPIAAAVDNNGMPDYRTYQDPADRQRSMSVAAEAMVQNPFTLKIQVREARLTNSATIEPIAGAPRIQTDGTFPQVDLRAPTAQNPAAAAFGANFMPTAVFHSAGPGGPANTALLLAWSSNRPDGFAAGPTTPDVPWRLAYAQLSGGSTVFDPAGGFGAQAPPLFGWRIDMFSAWPAQWWSPLGVAAPFPALSLVRTLFPAEATDVVGPDTTQLVKGNPITNAAGQPLVVYGSPGLVRDQSPTGRSADLWMFWQGAVHKTAGPGGGAALDARTFYLPVIRQSNGAYIPDLASAPGMAPYSFPNDPSLQKQGARPLVIDGTGLVFWYGGAAGRTRLYYNVNTFDPARNPRGMLNAGAWTGDLALPTPGGLQGLANPTPIPRRLNLDQRAASVITHVDVVYTGAFGDRGQPETFMTRYLLRELAQGRPGSAVVPFAPVTNELLARDGASQTWSARDVAWQYRNPANGAFVDGSGNSPYIEITVNGVRVNPGAPTFDAPTGKLYFNSTLGGRLIVDPQAGTVTFPDIAPRINDAVRASYIPQTLRLNVTRSETGAVTVPAGWAADPGFASQPAIAATGANTGPVALLDLSDNPRRITEADSVRSGFQGARRPTVSRLWLLYRKTGSNITSSGGLYYKTMRLVVRLPRPALRNADGTIGANVQISGNRGPVEIDWQRGRLYFTEIDEGALIDVTMALQGGGSVQASYRVTWCDEISVAATPGDQSVGEVAVPTDAAVNEGQVSAVKDPFVDRLWVFWSSTRSGTSDLYYLTLSPPFYPQTYP